MTPEALKLILAPFLGVLIISVCVYVSNPQIGNFQSFKSLQLNEQIHKSDTTCSGCPSVISETPCSDSSYPVLGGLDVVQYFTEFKKDDGTFDEDSVGTIGSSDYSSTYDGFTFYFKSSTNKVLFDTSPLSYIPQYGGFCSWAISGEYCPEYPWSSTCMGPSGNWAHWTIQDDKLYFFFLGEAKSKFMSSVDDNIAAGDSRWSSFFSTSHFNTQCYETTDNDASFEVMNPAVIASTPPKTKPDQATARTSSPKSNHP